MKTCKEHPEYRGRGVKDMKRCKNCTKIIRYTVDDHYKEQDLCNKCGIKLKKLVDDCNWCYAYSCYDCPTYGLRNKYRVG